jgi:hypothetical protein
MPKRKRENDDQAVKAGKVGKAGGPWSRSTLRDLVEQELANARKRLIRATALASRIERQKLGRRIKNAMAYKQDKDVERFNVEIQAIQVRTAAIT